MTANWKTPKTAKGYELLEVASAFQKAIRRGEEDVALFFGVELFENNYDAYAWKRMKIITSEDVGLAEPLMPANIAALYQMYQEQKRLKDDKHRPERLFFVHAILLLCRAKKSRLVDWTLIDLWENHAKRKMEIPDYAYDKHNARGRRMGRGIDHFFNEGSHLENAAPQDREAERKASAYEAMKGGPKTGDLGFEDQEGGTS